MSIVESANFRVLLKQRGVGRGMIENIILCLSNVVEGIIGEALKRAEGVAFTTDGSSFYTSQHYIDFTCHFILDWQLHSALVGFSNVTESETANFLSTMIGTVIDHWNENKKVTAVVTENGANFLAVVNKLVQTEQVEESLRCSCHNFHLIVKNAISSCPAIESLVGRCRALVSTITNSSILFNLFQALRKGSTICTLIRDMPTRWNTIFFMIERLLLVRSTLNQMRAAEEINGILFSDAEWEILEQLCHLLRPIKDCSKVLQGEI